MAATALGLVAPPAGKGGELMPRRGNIPKRDILADPQYESDLVAG